MPEVAGSSGFGFTHDACDAYASPTEDVSAGTVRIPSATAAAIGERDVLRYVSCAFDAHSGLYYLSKRYYDPATCQFITKDPAKADGEESAYQYCGGDPVGKVDPSGEAAAYPILTRFVTYRDAKKLGWRMLLGWMMPSSHIRIQLKFSSRYDKDYPFPHM